MRDPGDPRLRDQIRRARKNFAAMAATYSLGAFNDNFYKQAAMLTAVAAGLMTLQGYALLIFTLPYVLLAAPAGWAADRFPKRWVVIGSKFLELVAAAFGAVGICMGNWPMIFTMLAVMGVQATFFSPALNGAIPELYPPEYVTRANSIMKILTTVAILAGVATAGIALDVLGTGPLGIAWGRLTVAIVIISVAVLGVAGSFGVPSRPAAAPAARFPWDGVVRTWRTLADTGKDKLLAITIAANAAFWFIASLQLLLINPLGVDQMKYSKSLTSYLVAAELVGMAIGGFFIGRISKGRRWYGVLWPSAFVLGALMLPIAAVPYLPESLRLPVLFVLLAAMGVAGGFFLVPTESFIQVRPAADVKGSIISAANSAAFAGIILSSFAANYLNVHIRPTTGFLIAGVFTIALSAWLGLIWNSSVSRRSPAAHAAISRARAVLDWVLYIKVKFILSLRYRVTVTGLDEVTAKGRTGILFLPNHPALMDPFIVISRLYRPFRPKFLADRDQINRPVVGWLAARFGALPIPDVAKYGPDSKSEIDAALAAGIEGLKNGENWLFYPAGHIYRSYREDLGGNSAVEKILHGVPSARVVLVRTRGMWGSSFSRREGRQPSVSSALTRGALALLANGIFFTPRRRVTIELYEPPDLPRAADRHVINRWLEDFYNAAAPHNTYVPLTIWERGSTCEVPEPAVGLQGAALAVPASTRARVLARLEEMTGIKTIRDEDSIGRDLGLDSLARVDLSLWIEDQFGFASADPEGLQTVADVIEAAAGEALSGHLPELKKIPAAWFAAAPLVPVEGANIAEAFLAQARRTPGKPVVADQFSGVLTYRDVIAATLALKPEIEALPGSYVAIMLPASVAVDLTFLAAVFAGKTPVMVNWTVGIRNILHSLDLLAVKSVITARPLVKRIEKQIGSLAAIEPRFIYLEDLKAKIGLAAKLRAYAKSRLSWRELSNSTVTETAVVLFTSGSESLPKAVPLTHANILANIRDGVAVLAFRPDDRILGLFPPFHSFGVTTNMMLPLVAGIRTVYHPNPTEGAALARLVGAYKCTLAPGTPTFLKGIVRSGSPSELASLRLVVSGAERCPETLYEAFAARCPRLVVLEGYGVTECSPIISVNDYHVPRAFTIGKVVPSLEYRILSVETGKRVDRGAPGVLLVRGPSVFPGYLNYQGESPSGVTPSVVTPSGVTPSGETPFVDFEGKSWYRTGDIVSEDSEGVLTFRGRLKRFVKIGGEMISLPAVEAVLDRRFAAADAEGPAIAVEATGDEARPELVLFTTLDLDRETVNREIRSSGLSPLYSISRVTRLESIPLLGTGKTDYRALKSLLAPAPREGQS